MSKELIYRPRPSELGILSQTSHEVGEFLRGDTVVIVGASGVGKTTLIEGFVSKHPSVRTLRAYTDRPPRIYGENKICISSDEFDKRLINNDFFDCSEVYGCRVANSREDIKTLDPNSPLIFDYPLRQMSLIYEPLTSRHPVVVALLPPSIDELSNRLHQRPERFNEALRDIESLFYLANRRMIDLAITKGSIAQNIMTIEKILGLC